MSTLQMLNDEIFRRRQANAQLQEDIDATLSAIEQFNKLDELHRNNQKASEDKLNCFYGENKHFSGKIPSVYTLAQTEIFPYFGGATDNLCNPYYPITKVQDNTFDGLAPLYASPTRTGAFQRDADFSPTEDVARAIALDELLSFPDISGEPLPSNWPDEQDPGEPDPVWNGPDTAPALLRVALESWKDDILLIQSSICEDGTVNFDFWQSIVDDIDIVLAAVANDAVFVRATGNNDPAAWGQTQDFVLGSPEDLARNRLIVFASTDVPNYVIARSAELSSLIDTEEQIMFGVIKLRLHIANGSYSKIKSAKDKIRINKSLIQDNLDSIASLNLLKVQLS